MDWKGNPIIEWSLDGVTWTKISDHGRGPLDVDPIRIENKQRMAHGTLRRYVVAKKRQFSMSWENLPDKSTPFLAGGQTGQWMRAWHDSTDGAFYMRLREGAAINGDTDAMETVLVMITEFGYQITKRNPVYDLWDLDITLEEV